VTARHQVDLDNEDVELLERCGRSHAAIVRQIAEVFRATHDNERVANREADRLAHTISIVQTHVRGHCDCPKGEP
jgi:hypothetical protein